MIHQDGVAARLARAIDRLSAAAATVSGLALLAITLIACFEVGSRYLFNRPTIWAWDVNVQLMATMVMLGLAQVHRKDLNVRVDVLTGALPPRGQALLGLLFGALLIAVAAVVAWTCWEYFLRSWTRDEHASSLFAPPLWPVKFMLPLGAALLLLQAVVQFLRAAVAVFAPAAASGHGSPEA
ncbi:TRAP transporter small permease subunit [uncultured Albimonas sp.]|uniref:TRAP transporter small permease subunit n=1 Tax=uncultured Albimonas sp. TaxID=1331701 RepID=UPI0030EE239C|tara:strand:- start:384 stop:929 length:546 start_codon:yes stop_codon:yes gene_type:complete